MVPEVDDYIGLLLSRVVADPCVMIVGNAAPALRVGYDEDL